VGGQSLSTRTIKPKSSRIRLFRVISYYYSTVHHAWKHIMAGSYTTCSRTNMPRKGHVCRNPSNNIVDIISSNHKDLAFVFTNMKDEHPHRVNVFPPIVPSQTIFQLSMIMPFCVLRAHKRISLLEIKGMNIKKEWEKQN